MKYLIHCVFWLGIGFSVLAYQWEGMPMPTPYAFPDLFRFPTMPVAEDNPVTEEGQWLGRHLFYDPILSEDSTMSCASCHLQEYAFADHPDHKFSLGVNDDTLDRNTMPLFNLAWYPKLFWDGRSTSIEEQVFHPVRAHKEMNLDWNEATQRINNSNFYPLLFEQAFGDVPIDSNLIAKAIAQFERILISNGSKYDRVLKGEAYFTEKELKGFEFANDQSKGNCFHCHPTDSDALGTKGGFSNNGLDQVSSLSSYMDNGLGDIIGDSTKNAWFKIPSLRNVALTAPYMHDGRFQTLEEVVAFYSNGIQNTINIDSKMAHAHRGGMHLTEEDQHCIVQFLHTLTDSTFIKNSAFSNPFEKK